MPAALVRGGRAVPVPLAVPKAFALSGKKDFPETIADALGFPAALGVTIAQVIADAEAIADPQAIAHPKAITDAEVLADAQGNPGPET